MRLEEKLQIIKEIWVKELNESLSTPIGELFPPETLKKILVILADWHKFSFEILNNRERTGMYDEQITDEELNPYLKKLEKLDAQKITAELVDVFKNEHLNWANNKLTGNVLNAFKKINKWISFYPITPVTTNSKRKEKYRYLGNMRMFFHNKKGTSNWLGAYNILYKAMQKIDLQADQKDFELPPEKYPVELLKKANFEEMTDEELNNIMDSYKGRDQYYYSTDEYSKVLPYLKKITEELRKRIKQSGEKVMRQMGLEYGDRVSYFALGLFGLSATQYLGTVVKGKSGPFIRLDPRSAALAGVKRTGFHKGWKKAK